MHDRLGDCIGYFPRNQEELEEMADARYMLPMEFLAPFSDDEEADYPNQIA